MINIRVNFKFSLRACHPGSQNEIRTLHRRQLKDFIMTIEGLIEASVPFSVYFSHIFLFLAEPLWNRYLEQCFILFRSVVTWIVKQWIGNSWREQTWPIWYSWCHEYNECSKVYCVFLQFSYIFSIQVAIEIQNGFIVF